MDDKIGKAADGRDSFLKRMVKVATTQRNQHESDQLEFNCADRQMIQWASLVLDLGVKTAAKVTLLGKSEPEEYDKILQQINKEFRDDEGIAYTVLQARMQKEEEEALNAQLQSAQSKVDSLNSEDLSSELSTTSSGTEELPF